MRVRILRGPTAGRVVILPETEALALLSQGLVEEDKMLDGPREFTAQEARKDTQALVVAAGAAKSGRRKR